MEDVGHGGGFTSKISECHFFPPVSPGPYDWLAERICFNLLSVPTCLCRGVSLSPTPCGSTPFETAPSSVSIFLDEGLDGSAGLHTSV